jgi:transcriptional regulator with XRE-family HTH domain
MTGDYRTPDFFRTTRDYLAMSVRDMATYLDVSPRTIRHWEAGNCDPPPGAWNELEGLGSYTAHIVWNLVEELSGTPAPTMVTYRTNADYQATRPALPLPASWHRAVCARVAQQIPGLAITYHTEETP